MDVVNQKTQAHRAAPSGPCHENVDFPRPFRWTRQAVPLAVMALALALIAGTSRTYYPINDIVKHLPASFSDFGAQMANPFTVVALCAGVWICDRRRRPALAVFLVSLAMLGLVNEPIKQVAGRARPRWSIDQSKENREWINQYTARHPGVSFGVPRRDAWLGFQAGRPYFESGFVSFPSGHSAQAFLTAAFLIVLYPRGRWLWLLLAASCALARVAQRVHFVEDTLFGGAFGWMVAQWVFAWAWPARLGARLFDAAPAGGKKAI